MTDGAPSRRTVRILDVPVDVLTRQDLLDRVAAFIGPPAEAHAPGGPRRTVAYANLHVLDQCATHPDLVAFLQGVDLCYCDGKGVQYVARLLGHHLPERMTGADWIWDLARRAENDGWHLFWLGSEPGVTDAAARVLQARHPRLQVTCDHGYHAHSGPEHDALLRRINGSRPHVLLVGMGTPLQERWVAANRSALEVPVVWALGATADFISGRVSRGPRFLYDRQEWLARLLVDPQRLWRRYLLGNGRVAARAVRSRFHL